MDGTLERPVWKAWMNAPVLEQLAAEHYKKSREFETQKFKSLPERVGLLMHVVQVDSEKIDMLVHAADTNNKHAGYEKHAESLGAARETLTPRTHLRCLQCSALTPSSLVQL